MKAALGNFGLGIIQEKILTNRIHMHYGAVYSVWATELRVGNCGVRHMCGEFTAWYMTGKTRKT